MKKFIWRIVTVVIIFAIILSIRENIHIKSSIEFTMYGILMYIYCYLGWTIPQLFLSAFVYCKIINSISYKLTYIIVGIFALIGFQEIYSMIMLSKNISNYFGLYTYAYSDIFRTDFQNFMYRIRSEYWDPTWLFYLPFNLVVNIFIGIKCYAFRNGK